MDPVAKRKLQRRTRSKRRKGRAPLVPTKRLRRALQVVRAATASDLPGCTPAEAAAVVQTNRWYRGSPNVIGTSIGPKARCKKWTGQQAVQILVQAKPREQDIPQAQRIEPVRIGRAEVPVDVIEVVRAELHVAPGHGIGAGTANIGSIGAVLADLNSQGYLVTAAHVICESLLEDDPGHRRTNQRGDNVFYHGPSGIEAGAVLVGDLLDRFVPDFTAQGPTPAGFPWQNVDAALVRMASHLPPDFDPASIPYGPAASPRVGDEVRVIGVGTGGVGAPGQVIGIDLSVAHPALVLADATGLLVPVHYSGLCAGLYECGKGDSGGPIIREDDGALLGFHIGALYATDVPGGQEAPDGSTIVGLFIPASRVLGRWPMLRLLHQ
jgi:hypothetical protein